MVLKMTTSDTLFATYTVDELVLQTARLDIEHEIRTRLAVQIVRELPRDTQDVSLTFHDPEPALYNASRYFVTARIDLVQELQEEIDRLRARVRALEWARNDMQWMSKGMEE